jgi:Flp pilus assembly protein TadG
MSLYTCLAKRLRSERGAVIVLFAILLIVILSFVALAVDLAHLFVVTNELQNAADAGALAGARFLHNLDGTINTGANQIAFDAATANKSDNLEVDVNWTGGNSGDVQRGHWSFTTRTFTPNDSTEPTDLWDRTTDDLDIDTTFINAVRVITRREETPAASYFARIFGFNGFEMNREAVAYIGYAGTLAPEEVDQPIAICAQALLINDEYTCSIGRMINSSGDPASSNTGGWTNFSQPCETASVPTVRPLVCGDGNPESIELGQGIGTVGGMQDNVFTDLRNCFDPVNRVEPWELTLPVIDCTGNNVSPCSVVVGAVTLQVVWITGSGEDPHYNNAPRQMGGWSSEATSGSERWDSFVSYFNLKNADNNPAPYDKKSMYFLPDCTPHEPKGNTGGQNFGILAKIPVLVQ